MLSNKILKKAILCSSITLYIAIGIQYLVLYPDTNVVKNSCVVLVEILAAAMTIYIQASYEYYRRRAIVIYTFSDFLA